MPEVRRHTDPPPAHETVVAWRAACLRRAGFERRLAERLARNHRYDVHGLLELIDRGCTPELAARILAPLDDNHSSPC